MASVADVMRAEIRRRIRGLTAAERIALALRLGDDDVALLAAARSVVPPTAREIIKTRRQAGRRPSCLGRST